MFEGMHNYLTEESPPCVQGIMGYMLAAHSKERLPSPAVGSYSMTDPHTHSGNVAHREIYSHKDPRIQGIHIQGGC